ncbi:hypothetical protein RSOLAG22IIIB_07558 [Rhizoctonia solani]|uniref:DUF7330 domain-containing protein n=1 Tax=Rhizoctonia solani TaxID=456999 RepID=A0A0K6FNB3_9AGAM|nr:hypothetical protein RSOLAG22IIIB_07558 [Rhizoctonia solani]
MILEGSENSGSKTAQTIRSEGSEADPQSPPPYTPSSAFSDSGDQKPLPTPPASSAGDYEPRLPQGLPPPCNYLIQRRSNDSIKGTWHVDPAMPIPDALIASVDDFDGTWNEAEQKARKERKKLEKKGKRRSDNPPTSTNGIRPNLMLSSSNGSIDAKVHIVSSDDQPRMGLVVAEGRNGSIVLDIKTYTPCPLRIYALSENGSVRVRVPDTFQGALLLSSRHGSIKISDPIKSRMTIFSTVSDTTRAFIGDWQGDGFGTAPSSSSPNPNDDPPLPTTPSDPFSSWSGPLIHIASRNGSVHLSYSEEPRNEEEAGGFSSAFKGFMSGLFGGGGDSETRERSGPGNGTGEGPSGSGRFPWGDGAPWGSDRYPWGNRAPWGDTKHPWGNGAPWTPPMVPPGPFGRGGGPFARGGGPFVRGGPFGGGPFGGRGCGFSRRGGFGSYSSGCSRGSNSEGTPPRDNREQAWDGDDVERDPYGFPKDKKDPSGI